MALIFAFSLSGISIHALREEGDRWQRGSRRRPLHFYPRPPRGGRPPTGTPDRLPDDFYPRPPRGGRLVLRDTFDYDISISIHALREEGDARAPTLPPTPRNFYPRPPRGGRRSTAATGITRRYFYPRPPRGGRHLLSFHICINRLFLSTPSARRATFSKTLCIV